MTSGRLRGFSSGASSAEAVYVLHAFEKRTQRTVKDDLDRARQRLRLLINQRARRKG